jgi:hypothetical protein
MVNESDNAQTDAVPALPESEFAELFRLAEILEEDSRLSRHSDDWNLRQYRTEARPAVILRLLAQLHSANERAEILERNLSASYGHHAAAEKALAAMTEDRDLWQHAHDDDCPNKAALEQAEKERDEACQKWEYANQVVQRLHNKTNELEAKLNAPAPGIEAPKGFEEWWNSARPFPQDMSDGELVRAAWTAALTEAPTADDVLSIRCMTHRNVPQENTNAHGAECAVCMANAHVAAWRGYDAALAPARSGQALENQKEAAGNGK